MNKYEAWSLLKEILRDTQSVMGQRYLEMIPEIEEVLEGELFPPAIVCNGEGEKIVGGIIPYQVDSESKELKKCNEGLTLSQPKEPDESQYEKPKKPPIRRIKEGSEKVRTSDEVVEK